MREHRVTSRRESTIAQQVPSMVPSAAERVDAQRHVEDALAVPRVERGLRVGRVDDLVGQMHRARRAAGDDAEQLAVAEHAAAEVVDELAQREPDARLVDARLLHVAADAEEAAPPSLQVVQRGELARTRRRPSRTRSGTTAMVSTLFTVVGQPNAPHCAGNGGLRRGSPRLPSSELSSAVSSPQMYAPAPVCT